MLNKTQEQDAAVNRALKRETPEERAETRALCRRYARGGSNPRLFDIARTHRVDGAGVLPILRKFVA